MGGQLMMPWLGYVCRLRTANAEEAEGKCAQGKGTYKVWRVLAVSGTVRWKMERIRVLLLTWCHVAGFAPFRTGLTLGMQLGLGSLLVRCCRPLLMVDHGHQSIRRWQGFAGAVWYVPLQGLLQRG